MTHPLNTWTVDIEDKRNLLKHGKVNALLDKMSADALANVAEVDKEIILFYRTAWLEKYHSLPAAWAQNKISYYEEDAGFIMGLSLSQREAKEKLYRKKQIQLDALAIADSIRKYTPFIEVGAMTIAEAISCERRGSRE